MSRDFLVKLTSTMVKMTNRLWWLNQHLIC